MSLFTEKPTRHRVLVGGRSRVVLARHDWEGNFVRFIVKRTQDEVEAVARSYGKAKVGVLSWFEVFEHNFQNNA